MIITAITFCILSLLITVYFLLKFLACYRAINSIAFVDLAQNPLYGAEAMREMIRYRNIFIIMAAVTILMTVAVIVWPHIRRKISAKASAAKEKREAKKKTKSETVSTGPAPTRTVATTAPKATKICPKCGKTVPDAIFCENCGANLKI